MSISVLQIVNSVNVLCFIYDPYMSRFLSGTPHWLYDTTFLLKCFNFNVFCKRRMLMLTISLDPHLIKCTLISVWNI